MKKLLAIFLVASFAFVGVLNASAVTVEELQAQIATLLQQISALSGTTTTTTTTTTSSSYAFTMDLSLGMNNNDVKALQERLGVTPTSGYFGPITLAAVKAYQASKGIITTGYVGPLTRAALNASVVVTTPTSTVPGCAAGDLFSSTTGASCTGTTTTTAPSTGTTEGTLTNETSPTFVETSLKKNDTQKAILATKVKAKNSSINVKRVDMEIAGTSIQPWKTFSTFELYADGTLIKGIPALKDNFIETQFVTKYVLRFDNISINVPKDGSVDLVVKTTVLANPENTAITTFKFLASAIRGVDQAGIDQYTSTAITNTISGSAVAASSTGTLLWSLNTSSPKTGFVLGSTTATSSDKVLAVYDVKAENRDVTIKTLNFTMTNADDIISALKLYDGSTLLASIAGEDSDSDANATFENLSILVAKDTTKTLTLKADLKPLSAEGKTIAAVMTGSATNVSAYDSSDVVLGATACNSGQCVTGTATGKTLTAYTKAPSFAFGSQQILKTTQAGANDIADATIVVNVTANGGDIYFKKTTDAGDEWFVVNKAGGAIAEANYTYTTNADAYDATYFVVRNGETKSFTITGRISGGNIFEQMSLASVKWSVNSNGSSPVTTTTAYDFADYKTTSVYLANA